MKRYLFVLRQPPHQSAHVQEVLDQILTTAAFDCPVTLLFLDDGVLQLVGRQTVDNRALKDTAATLGAVGIYGVEQLYVERESLAELGLAMDDLESSLVLQAMPRAAVGKLMRGFDVVIAD